MIPIICLLFFSSPLFSHEKIEAAKGFYRDQDLEMAFRVYLEALSEVPLKEGELVSGEDAHYEEALRLYLAARPDEAMKTASLIDKKYTPIYETHPEYHRIGFLLALSDANLGRYERFFDVFYSAFEKNPVHYLAYKTKAILHLKLFERTRDLVQKEAQRKKFLENIREAEALYPSDFSLYRLETTFLPIEKRNQNIKLILNKIVNQNMIPSRSDTVFFVDLARETGDDSLINTWLNKGLEWYPDSRTLKEMKVSYGSKNAR